jgi:hypothetical protein
MTLREKFEVVGVLVIMGLVSVGIEQHDLRVKAEATVEKQQARIDDAQKQRDDQAAADRDRDAKTAAAIADLQKKAAAAVTPQQIAKWIPAQLGDLPLPISIAVPPATAGNPTPAAVATIPEQDLAPLRNMVEEMQTCSIALPAAQQDLASCKTQLTEAGAQLSAAEKQRDAYKQALKGGTFWHRVKHDGKVLAIGGAIAAAAICGTGHCSK